MESKRIKKGLWAVITALLSILIAGCAAQPSAPPTAPPTPVSGGPTPTPVAAPKTLEKAKFAVVDRSAPYANFFVGSQQGVYKEEGIELEIKIMATQLVLPALLSGETDYVGSVPSTFTAALRGAPVKVLMNTNIKPIWHFFGAPGVTSFEQLKGKPIGTFSMGSGWHYVTRETLRAKGIDPDKEVSAYVPIPNGAALLAALKSGNLAGTLLSQPFSEIAKDQGLKELAYAGDLVVYPNNGVGITIKRLKENPDQVKRILRGTLKSLYYVRDHSQDVIDWLIKEAGATDKRIAEASYSDLARVLSKDGLHTEEMLKAMVQTNIFSGALKGNEDPKQGIDETLLREALKELGLPK